MSRLGAGWIPPVKKTTSWPISKFKCIYIQKKSSWPKQTVSNSSQIIQWSSVGHITIHFRGLRVLRRAPKQKFRLFDQKKFLRKCSYLGNHTSHRVGSGVKTTVRPRATHTTLQIKCSSSSFQDRLCFIKPLHFPWGWPKGRFWPVLTVSDPPCRPGPIFSAQNAF